MSSIHHPTRSVYIVGLMKNKYNVIMAQIVVVNTSSYCVVGPRLLKTTLPVINIKQLLHQDLIQHNFCMCDLVISVYWVCVCVVFLRSRACMSDFLPG